MSCDNTSSVIVIEALLFAVIGLIGFIVVAWYKVGSGKW